MSKLTFFVAAIGRERAYEPIALEEIGIAQVEARENLGASANRMWGIDILTLRLIDRLLTAEARVTALQEELARSDQRSRMFADNLDDVLTKLRAALVGEDGATALKREPDVQRCAFSFCLNGAEQDGYCRLHSEP